MVSAAFSALFTTKWDWNYSIAKQKQLCGRPVYSLLTVVGSGVSLRRSRHAPSRPRSFLAMPRSLLDHR